MWGGHLCNLSAVGLGPTECCETEGVCVCVCDCVCVRVCGCGCVHCVCEGKPVQPPAASKWTQPGTLHSLLQSLSEAGSGQPVAMSRCIDNAIDHLYGKVLCKHSAYDAYLEPSEVRLLGLADTAGGQVKIRYPTVSYGICQPYRL